VRCTATPAQPRCPPGCTGVAYPVRSTRPLPPHGRWVGAVAPGGSVAAARLSGLRTGHRGGATKRNIDTMAMTAREDTSSRMSGAIIAVRGIGKAYPRPGVGRAPVLHDIDLALAPGAILGLLGPNGAGKTTLIKILAGLLRPDTGEGTVLGFDLLRHHAAVRARVSLVTPTAPVGIDNNLTVRQNLAFWAPIYGLHGAGARARIEELLGKLGLVDKADFWPMHISAGQRQRLALARSLLAENRLVFLDEPTNKLDMEGVRSVRQMIAELNREQGATIILTTHVMEEAEELCGEIALLRQGELVAHQPTGA